MRLGFHRSRAYIKECDVLKGELTVKEVKVSEQAKQIRTLTKEHKKTDFEKEKKIRRLEEAYEKKEREK